MHQQTQQPRSNRQISRNRAYQIGIMKKLKIMSKTSVEQG